MNHPAIPHPIADLIARCGGVVVDGAMSTALESLGADLNDSLWSAKVLVENPDLIRQVHLDYYRSGANVAITASYQATAPGFAKKGIGEAEARRLIALSVALAKEAREAYLLENPVAKREDLLVAGAVGPYGAYLADASEYTGKYRLTRAEYEAFHAVRIEALLSAEPDLLLNASVFGTDAVFSDEPLFCERCEAAIPSENVEPKSAGGQRLPEPRLLVETAARPLRSHLLIEARRRGIPAVSGFELEVARARAVIEAFLGRPLRNCVSATIERDIRLEAENIVLIGMPGCGKTTIGKILAQRLMRRFVDVDELVAQHVGKFKARIYREEGEAFFREKETEAIRTLALKTGLIISTGGGSCLRPVNRALLGLNGRFIWLKRPLAKLATRDRPIAIARGVAALYEERAPIYSALADRTIEVSSIDETVRAILGEHA